MSMHTEPEESAWEPDDTARSAPSDGEAGPDSAAGATPLRGRGRRRARVLAFQTLYEMDVARHRPGEVLQRHISDDAASDEVGDAARHLVSGVLRERAEIDAVIQAAAPAYPLAQMSPVERNILRIGLFECLYTSPRVPQRVAVNEAIELAKQYGGDSTPRFVNGVLGQVIRARNLEAAPPAPEA